MSDGHTRLLFGMTSIVLCAGLSVLTAQLWAQEQPAEPVSPSPGIQVPDSQPSAGGLLGKPVSQERRQAAPSAAGNGSVSVSASDLVEIHVSGTPLTSVLRLLSTQSRRNIVTSSKVEGQVTADLYNVTFHQALDCILMPNDCAFIEEGNFIYVYTKAELAEKKTTAKKEVPQARLFRLRYVSIADVKPMVEPLLSKEGKISTTPEPESGLQTDPETAGGNKLSGPDVLMVFDYPSRLVEIEKVVRQLDVRPQQVLVEATILQAQLNENTDLGRL